MADGCQRSVMMPSRVGIERSRMSVERLARKKSDMPAAQEGSPTSIQATKTSEIIRMKSGRWAWEIRLFRAEESPSPGPHATAPFGLFSSIFLGFVDDTSKLSVAFPRR